MAISFVAAGAVATGVNPSIGMPAGIVANDFLILVITNTAAVTTPTGWTALTTYTAATPQMYLFTKIATGSETAITVTLTTTCKAVTIAYRGTSGIDVFGTYKNASTTVATNTLTTTQANDYVISIWGQSNTLTGTFTAPTGTGLTTQVNSGSVSAVSRGLLIVDELQASAGATTARTATASVANVLTSIALSLKPSGVSANNGSFFFLM